MYIYSIKYNNQIEKEMLNMEENNLKNIDIAEQLEYIKKVQKLNMKENSKYYILTMGCQLNENDSEKLLKYSILSFPSC